MKKKNILIAAALLLLTIIVGAFYVAVVSQKSLKNTVPLVLSFNECAAAGYPIAESYPRQCRTPDGRTFVEDIGNEPDTNDQIRVTSPRPNQVITSPLEIVGEARGNWYFEASFPVKLVDAKGHVLAVMPIMTEKDWMTTAFVPFKAALVFSAPETETGTLILEKDNPSGLAQYADKLSIPIRFAQTSASKDTAILNVYFGNSYKGAECKKVVSIPREVTRTPAVARAAIEALLKGPTDIEKTDGYTTSINPETSLRSLRIENETAFADFSKELGANVAGSCRVMAIRSQISETLKQFPSIRSVTISIEGKTDDILQP
ncbi:MAG: GerMN domain-containing protein [bacterium]|nr:GerMN domain-containing protein [bacterium]